MQGRLQRVPVFVGLALASVTVLTLLALAAGEASISWKRIQIVIVMAAGVTFVIGWAGTHFSAWIIAARRRVAIFALLLFIAMGLCPPWVHTVSPEGAATTTKPAGYRLLFDPPEPEWLGVRIDTSRLAIQWAVLAAVVAVAFVLTYGKATGKGTESGHESSDGVRTGEI